jgi:glycosyltransferase involved in cell wall biosynthesis
MPYRIWIVTIGEPLPIDPGEPRLLRAGMLAGMLARAGHDVTWWTANFDHRRKINRFDGETERVAAPNLRLVLLNGPVYRSNVSLARILHHRAVARAFTKRAATEPPPDVILCSLPSLELARAAARYGKERGVPVIMDIRDLWPDAMVDLLPAPLRWVGSIMTAPLRRDATLACRNAAAIVGLTDAFRDWGLTHAGRRAAAQDRVFPLAYSDEPPDAAAIKKAAARWDDLKVLPEDFIICFFGFLGVQFEFDPVIEAARLLRQKNVLVKFVICGEGDSLPRLRSQSAKLDNVVLPGWVDAPEIWTLMRRSRLGLAPYIDSENFRKNVPNKIAEYLSGGVPILTNLEGRVRTVLTENECGYFYRHGSGRELAEVIEGAIRDPAALERRARNAAALFTKSFSADRIYAHFVSYLEAAANTGVRAVDTV